MMRFSREAIEGGFTMTVPHFGTGDYAGTVTVGMDRATLRYTIDRTGKGTNPHTELIHWGGVLGTLGLLPDRDDWELTGHW